MQQQPPASNSVNGYGHVPSGYGAPPGAAARLPMPTAPPGGYAPGMPQAPVMPLAYPPPPPPPSGAVPPAPVNGYPTQYPPSIPGPPPPPSTLAGIPHQNAIPPAMAPHGAAMPPTIPRPAVPMAPRPHPGAAEMDHLTSQMQHLNTQPGALMGQPVGIIGAPLPLQDLYNEPRPAIQPPINPAFVRVTLNKIPKTMATLSKTKLPFGITITPYPVTIARESVPVISGPIVRCRRCRTYLNPFVEMLDQGAKWRCNLCFLDNDFPANFDYDVATQRYLERTSKAELYNPVYEFVAPVEYMVRPPQPPVYLFLLDVSHQAVSSGLLATAAKVILDTLDALPNAHDRTRIAIMTVDSTIHFYSLSPTSDEPKMLVISDLEEPFLPCVEDLLVGLTEARGQIEKLLSRLAAIYANTQVSSSALGSALTAASKLMASIGGKIVVVQAALPNLGMGKVKNREDPRALGTSRENGLLQPENNFYKSLATECSRNQVCIDLFLAPPAYVDVATLGCAARFTGGRVFYQPNFTSSSIEMVEKFAGELTNLLKDEVGLEAVLRIRASQGVTLSTYHGSFFLRSTDLLALPNVNSRHSYSAQVTIDENINSRLLCIQAAVLHTNCEGERRIRVVNAAFPVSDDPREIILHADLGAITDLLLKLAVDRALSHKLEDARDAILNKINEILAAIKTIFQTGQNPQLLLTENLRLLPLLFLSVLKSLPIRSGSGTPPDLRSHAMLLARTMSVQDSLHYLHPFMFAVHRMPDEAGRMDAQGENLVLPPALNLGSDQLERHGLFVLHNGIDVFIWVGSQVYPELCQLIFNCQFADINVGPTTLPSLDNDWSRRVHSIINHISRQHQCSPITHVIREDSDPALKSAFLSQLIEDRSPDQPSYTSWAAALRDKLMASR